MVLAGTDSYNMDNRDKAESFAEVDAQPYWQLERVGRQEIGQ